MAPLNSIAAFSFLLGLLTACSIAPGFALIRRLKWAPLETLCASLATSLVFLYLASFLISGLRLPEWSYLVVTAACLALAIAHVPSLRNLFRETGVRSAGAAFACLFCFGLFALLLIRDYSGGICAFDWLEHYERSLYFLRVPRDYQFLSVYRLTARPPLMNLLGAFFLAQTGKGFPVFEIVFLYLNLLTFFPLCLMAQEFAKGTRHSIMLLTGLLLANPMLWWNDTWTWTKEFTAFYVILGLWLYLSGWRRTDGVRLSAAFLALSAAFLVHYSAGPYLIFFSLHYVSVIFPRQPNKWRKLLLTASLSAALLATWFVPALARFGARDTFASNTTVTLFQVASRWRRAETIGLNLITSTVPYPLVVSKRRLDGFIAQPSAAGYLRDAAICLYCGNAIASMGLIGGPLVFWLLLKRVRNGPGQLTSETAFWLGFVVFCSAVGIAVDPAPTWVGVWAVCCQPITLLGVAFFSSKFLSLPRLLRYTALIGCGFDFAVGIFLHFVFENRPHGESLSQWAALNYSEKVSAHVTYLGDQFAHWAPVFAALLTVIFCMAFARIAAIAGLWPSKARLPLH